MKRLFAVLAITAAAFSTPAHAALKVIGKGDSMRLDSSSFPPNMKAAYETMKVRCVKCHTLERTIVAVQTGIAPISGQPFDKGATKAYGIKMMRKPDSGMSKQEVKETVDLMNYLIEESAR